MISSVRVKEAACCCALVSDSLFLACVVWLALGFSGEGGWRHREESAHASASGVAGACGMIRGILFGVPFSGKRVLMCC